MNEINPYEAPQVEDASAAAPEETVESPTEKTKTQPTFHQTLVTSFAWQCLVFLLTALILDGGTSNRLAIIAAIGYWITVGLIMVRRSGRTTVGDMLFARYGYVLCLAVACLSRFVLNRLA